jgi:hypothetical protein
VIDPVARPDAPVAVVGAGLAGLSCAVALHRAGVPVELYEASDGVGGRVRSDHVDGFILDRGFQVALTAYPEMHRQLDMEALDLQAFDPGALVWRNGKGSVVADPFRQPTTTLSTVSAPIGSLFDKARIALLRHRVRGVHPVQLLKGPDAPTRTALADAGFSDTIIERFFRPLVGGIQLDPDLTDSRRMFDIIFRMLADGDSAVPAAGMQAIPQQLADRLPPGTIHLDSPVTATTATSITVRGEHIAAAAVVVATEGPIAAALLDLAPVESKSVGAVYFAAPEPPVADKLVVLDGSGRGPGTQRRGHEQRRCELRPCRFAPRRRSAPRPRRTDHRDRRPLPATRLVGGPGRRLGPRRHLPHRPRPAAPTPAVRPQATCPARRRPLRVRRPPRHGVDPGRDVLGPPVRSGHRRRDRPD